MKSTSKTAKPGKSPPVELRLAQPGDEEFLADLYASTRSGEMELVDWPEEQKEAFLRSQFQAQKNDYEDRFPESIHQIVMVSRRPAGRVWIDWREDELRLLDIALLPEFRDRGIGAGLIANLQKQAKKRKKPMRHCVLEQNRAAFRFYQRLDFKQIDEFGVYVMMEWNPPV